jgi:diaminopimelate epimerase
MMFIDFEKWHGTKNDFVIVRLSSADGDLVLSSIKRLAKSICDRNTGIGADGILVLHSAQRGELTPDRLTIINSDGSLAKNCGNGLRCAALSILRAHLEKGDPNDLPEAVELMVEGVGLTCRFLNNQTINSLVAVEMPDAKVGKNVPWGTNVLQATTKHLETLGLNKSQYELEVCDLGNPHVVISTEGASRDLMLKIGPPMQKLSELDGINVHVIKSAVLSDKDRAIAKNQLGHTVTELFTMYVWERGAGETMACGTGACAVGLTALASGLTDRSEWIAVDMPGGRVYVNQKSADDAVTLAGPATFVFSGKIEI